MNLFSNPEYDDLYRQIKGLQEQIAQVRSQKDQGNLFYGGPVKTYLSTSGWSNGPFIENLDPTHDIDFNLWVPDYLIRILRVQFRLRPKAIRLPATVATQVNLSTGGSSTGGVNEETVAQGDHPHSLSGDTGGPSAHMSGVLVGHVHRFADFLSTTAASQSNRVFQDSNGRGFEFGANNASDLDTFGSNSSVNVPDTNHEHAVGSLAVADNIAAVNVPSLFHTHTYPHQHALTLGISEGGSAAGLRVHIDGIDRTAALGGPWSAAATIDISSYLQDVRRRPIAGDHPIKIESTAVGAIELFIDWFVITAPIR